MAIYKHGTDFFFFFCHSIHSSCNLSRILFVQGAQGSSILRPLFKRFKEPRYPPSATVSSPHQPWVLLETPVDQPPQLFNPGHPYQYPIHATVPQHPMSQVSQQPTDTVQTAAVAPQQEAPATVPSLVADWSPPNRECPVCKALWPPGDDIIQFERHVNGHFSTN